VLGADTDTVQTVRDTVKFAMKNRIDTVMLNILTPLPGTPQFQRVSVPLVIGVSAFTAAIFFGIVTFAIRAQKVPIRTGQESLIGRTGVARSELNPGGTVQAGGELWTAQAETGEAPIPAGSRVEIVRVEGVHVFVRKVGGQAD